MDFSTVPADGKMIELCFKIVFIVVILIMNCLLMNYLSSDRLNFV